MSSWQPLSGCHLRPVRRVTQLERSGVISGYHADLDAAKLGHDVLVLIQITLVGQSAEMLAEFEAAAAAIPQVLACFLIAGESDYILRGRPAALAILAGCMRKICQPCRMCCAWRAAL